MSAMNDKRILRKKRKAPEHSAPRQEGIARCP